MMPANELAAVIVKALDAKKGENIQLLKTQELTTLADYFVICTATSRPQINAVVDAVREQFRDAGLRKPAVEGQDQSKWVLLDAGDVVGHVFAPDERAFYNLETFWANARRPDDENIVIIPAEGPPERAERGEDRRGPRPPSGKGPRGYRGTKPAGGKPGGREYKKRERD